MPPLLCYAGLIFCFHHAPSIHLKGGKPPTTNRKPETSVELGSALCFLTLYTRMQGHKHAHAHLCCVYGGRFAKRSIAQAQKGINVLAAGPLDLSSQRPPPVPFLQYENTSSASSHLHLPLCQHSFLRADNELCSSVEERSK